MASLRWILMLACVPAFAPAAAQTSASYKLTEAVMNNGAASTPGMASAHFHIKLDAVGEGVAQVGLASASFHADGGFVGAYRPPGEVSDLRFTSKVTLLWDPEPSIGRYEVYRGTLASLPGSFGACLSSDLPAATASDPSVPALGQGSYYLVTARNRLREEGTKGYRSNGAERPNAVPCP